MTLRHDISGPAVCQLISPDRTLDPGCQDCRIFSIFSSGKRIEWIDNLELSDPAAPSFVEAYPIPGCVYSVAVFDKYLFVTTESSFLIFQDSDLLQIDTFIPTGITLLHSYPNPFNLQTTIKYQLPINSSITLRVYDLLGREIRTLVNENQYAGNYSVVWDGNDNNGNSVCTGIYYYMLQLDNSNTQSENFY